MVQGMRWRRPSTARSDAVWNGSMSRFGANAEPRTRDRTEWVPCLYRLGVVADTASQDAQAPAVVLSRANWTK